MSTSPSTPPSLTWLSGQVPASEADQLLRHLWKILGDKDAKDVFGTRPFEQRDVLPAEPAPGSRYTYIDSANQIMLLHQRNLEQELMLDLFCVPAGDALTFGARLPASLVEQVRGVTATAGTVHQAEPDLSWPDVFELRTVIADAQAEEELDGTPVASLVAERDFLINQLAEANESVRQARFLAKSLKDQLGASATSLPTIVTEPEYPESLDDLASWAKQYSSRLIIAERAIRGGKKSLYRDPELVYRCLEHLATRYWELKTAKISVAAHDAALAALPGVSLRGSTGVTVAGVHGETYFITHNGHRVFLDLHLAKGGGMDQRYCMRIYFAWLPDEQRVLVGDLPAHLINSLA